MSLGVGFFIIYAADFPAGRLERKSVVYVDDDLDVEAEKNPEELRNELQKEADHTEK